MNEENNEQMVENTETVTENTVSIKEPKKKNKNIIYIIIIVLLIIGFGLYICYDKGIIFKKKSDSNKSSEKDKKTDNKDDKGDIAPDKKDDDKEDDVKPDDNTDKDNKTTVTYPKSQAKYKEGKTDNESIYEYPNYTFTIKGSETDNEEDFYEIKIYNSNGKYITTGLDYPDGVNYALNEDGSVTILGKYDESTESYDYERYDNNGNKIKNLKNYTKIAALLDNYMIVVKDKHVLLQDYNGNYVKGFDFDLSKGNYEFVAIASGWYTDEGKNGIFAVIENHDLEDGQKGVKIEYYFKPSTGKIGTILLDELGGYAKPVLYLYPEKDTKVKVSFEKPELLTTTYPKFKNNWEVVAKPNGDLTDKDGKYYYGLYWEESGSTKVDFTEGFYVTKNNAIKFLEEKLSYIGLNDRERNEFIMYWLPILEKNNKSIVYFELTEERNAFNKLIIKPNPDSLLRVAIHVKKIDNKPTNLKEEKLVKFNRSGFTAVEWGGVIH